MYHIDVTYPGSNTLELTDKKIGGRESNNLYESLIVEKLNQINCNHSACFYCNTETTNRIPLDNREIVELECNGLLNNNFCIVPSHLKEKIYPEDFIIVKNEDCFEIAQIKHIGEIVRMKRHSLGLFDENLPEVVRKARTEDLERVRKNLHDETRAVPFFRQAINMLNLNMKLVSIHFQFDRKKLFFFYTSDGRVDFRELAKDLASEFKTRIELRQIGVRDEAKKTGGLGTCGREYCCIAFLSTFKRITTQLANEQNLLSSMGKLSGPCGKLKCCLSFEVD